MKKTILTAFMGLCIIAHCNVSAKSRFPETMNKKYVESLKNEKIKTIKNYFLNSQLEYQFKPLFDEVNEVDAQYSKESGYYYIVFGKKEGVNKIEMLKVEKSDIDNSTYSYIDFTDVDPASIVSYCRKGAPNPGPLTCSGPCQDRGSDPCLGIICGIAPNCDQN